jgi:hypothetical protein
MAVHDEAVTAVANKLRALRYEVCGAGAGGVGDLTVQCPSRGRAFSVFVRGMRARNNWVVKPVPFGEDVYYVLIVLSEDRFFVLSRREAEGERDRTLTRLKRSPDYPFHGFTFGASLPYENKWGRLPPA